MPFKPIPQITINGSNRFANGFIYGCNFSLGYSEAPTQISFNLVPAENQTSFADIEPNLSSEYTLDLGGIRFTQTKLIERNESTSVGQKILTLNFIDGSYILDKIYIGLANRHQQAKNKRNVTFNVPMYCSNCQGTASTKTTVSITRSLAGRPNTFDSKSVDPKAGGYIILGIEQFVEGICDVPDVAYNFTSLLNSMGAAGISVNGLTDLNPNYFQNYTGTLREVLSNWCSDFGYTFFWDFTSNVVQGLDLKVPVIDVSNVYDQIKSNTQVPVESINFSKTLMGTYNQSLISYYLKPSRSKNNTLTRYQKTTWGAIKLNDVVNPEFSSGRDAASFGVSAALQKFYPTARALYNFYYLGGGLPGIGSDYNVKLGMCMGLKSIGLTLPGAAALFDNGYSNKTFQDALIKFPAGYFHVYLYSRDLESRWEAFEVNIADNFIGRFYTNSQIPPKDVTECNEYSYYSRKYRAEPEGRKYDKDEQYENPLTKVLTSPNGYTPIAAGEQFILEKDATWGTTVEEVDEKILKGGDPLEGYKPMYVPIEGVAKLLLFGALKKLDRQDIIDKINSEIEEGWVPVLAFIPPASDVYGAFSVELGSATNERAKKDDSDDDDEEDKECNTLCERSFVEEVCENLYRGCRDPKPPKTGHRSNTATAVNLSVKDGSAQLIFPLETPYNGYIEHNSETKWTLFGVKRVLGDIRSTLNTMSIRVVSQNITNDYDDYVGNVDGDGITDVLVPAGGGGSSFTRMTMQQWHNNSADKLVNSVTGLQQKLNFRVIGLDFSFIAGYLDPKKGLQDIQISYDENGFYADLVYATRPKQLQNKESLYSRLGPTMLNLNSFGRSPQGSIARKGT
jgi:hypothetical protein